MKTATVMALINRAKDVGMFTLANILFEDLLMGIFEGHIEDEKDVLFVLETDDEAGTSFDEAYYDLAVMVHTPTETSVCMPLPLLMERQPQLSSMFWKNIDDTRERVVHARRVRVPAGEEVVDLLAETVVSVRQSLPFAGEAIAELVAGLGLRAEVGEKIAELLLGDTKTQAAEVAA